MRKHKSHDMGRVCALEAADIVLVHTRHSLWASIIRLGTHCYWNHAAIVCRAAGAGHPYEGALLVDAKTDGCMEIRPAEYYLGNPHKYVVGVKKLDSCWERMYPGTQQHFLGNVCNLAMSEVPVDLGLPIVEHLDKSLRQITVVLRFLRRKLGRICRPAPLPWSTRPLEVKAFTCAGFVQWCYYIAASRVLNCVESAVPRGLVFSQRAKDRVGLLELLTTTPADLAQCANLSWKYVG